MRFRAARFQPFSIHSAGNLASPAMRPARPPFRRSRNSHFSSDKSDGSRARRCEPPDRLVKKDAFRATDQIFKAAGRESLGEIDLQFDATSGEPFLSQPYKSGR